MNVRELMTAEVLTVSPETPLKDVAAILAEHGISGLPVCDAEGRVLGVVSEGDILFKEQGTRERHGGALAWLVDGSRFQDTAKQDARTAGEAMTSPPITITPDRPAAAAARIMLDRGVNRLPVVRDGTLVGIVTRADLVRAFTRADEEIVAEIRDDVLRRALWLEPDSVEITVRRGEVELSGEIEAKSDVEVLKKLVQRIPGVVSVTSNVLYRVDDLSGVGAR
ncbi:MAG: CBS domain-containing protein [Gaiellaceae bacterium]